MTPNQSPASAQTLTDAELARVYPVTATFDGVECKGTTLPDGSIEWTPTDGPSDQAIISAMRKYGGGFERALALALQCADAENFARLKAALPEVFKKFGDLVGDSR